MVTITFRRAAAMLAAASVVLAACGGGAESQSGGGPSGDPVSGGVARVLQITEPRSLDPAVLGNNLPTGGLVGNALYGTLMIDDPQTGEIAFTMAEDFSSEDGGATFSLTLREGLVYSDGTPVTAADVQYNWERLREPTLGSASLAHASLIVSTEVTDDTTLSVTMVEPVPNFAHVIATSSLNWIGKPDVLEAGQSEIDSAPIGAGPFVLESWSRQDVIELTRNDEYWDAPKPYLDGLELRTVSETAQRYNTFSTGAADIALELEPLNVAVARDAGEQVDAVPLSGGLVLLLNTSRPPFDDLRAREAVALAIDFDVINEVTQEGHDTIPQTLFDDGSPFFEDVTFRERDAERAQELFDELAAEGKPVTFTYKAPAITYGPLMGESIQAQLATFDHVDVEVEGLDIAEISMVGPSGDFEMFTGQLFFADPEPQLYLALHGDSPANYSRIDDPELNAALEQGRVAENVEERSAAYATVQERLVELVPVIFHARASFTVLAHNDVGGIQQYGIASLLPEELWLEQ